MIEKVVLVDEKDREVGEMEKMEAHRKGQLHRAFSVVVFNNKGEILLQKRNKKKYHSGGLWTNTCCGHPRPGEGIIEAGERRLFEEMGIKVELKEKSVFMYKVQLGKELWENEIDYVLVGNYEGEIKPDSEEVEEWKWGRLGDIKKDIVKNPEQYTYWFRTIVQSAKIKAKFKVKKSLF